MKTLLILTSALLFLLFCALDLTLGEHVPPQTIVGWIFLPVTTLLAMMASGIDALLVVLVLRHLSLKEKAWSVTVAVLTTVTLLFASIPLLYPSTTAFIGIYLGFAPPLVRRTVSRKAWKTYGPA